MSLRSFIRALRGPAAGDSGVPRLNLGQSLGAFPRPGGDISPLFVLFDVTNAGEEEVEITRLYVRAGKDFDRSLNENLGGEKPLPVVLAAGEGTRFWFRAKVLAGALKNSGYGGRPKVRLVVADTSGNECSKSFRFRVDDYLALKDE